MSRWQNINSSQWEERTAIVAKLIPQGRTVLDIGSGDRALEKYLPRGCKYIPLDILDRGPDTFLCDLNAEYLEPFPDADVAVCCGVLEYVHDVPRLFAHIPQSAKLLIATYATTESRHTIGEHDGWVNALSKGDIVRAMVEAGFRDAGAYEQWKAQTIFLGRR